MFVGIDWAAASHAVHVQHDDGRRAAAFMIAHCAEGLEELVGRLARFGEPGGRRVGIERGDGRLVDRLLEAGHPVVAVSPKAIKVWRESEVSSGAKSDPGDAEVICDYVRLRFDRLAVLTPFSPATRALRATVHARSDLVAQRVAVCNQLGACLDAFWPGAKDLFRDPWSNIALAFLEDYPCPQAAARMGERRMAGFLARHRYSGHKPAAELVAKLRAAPAGITGVEAAARSHAVLGYVGVLRALNEAIRTLEDDISAQLDAHPDGIIFSSLPRSGVVNAAQMLAQWGDCRGAYAGADSVAALAGVSPVTRASGKHRSVGFRWTCNKQFRQAITTFADNSRHSSPWAADVYQRARQRGCDHPHAVRIVARAWIRVIWRCWIDQVRYDPANRTAATRLAERARAADAA